MIDFRHQKIEIEKTGHTATIPDASMARLMYYLNSVDALTDFGIPYELKNYDSYSQLSFDQENQVIALAFLLSPDLFVEKRIMVNEPSLCGNYLNEFYKITDNRTAVAATPQFVIAGKIVHTLEIMAFKMDWIRKYFVEPMNYYDRRLSAIADGTVERMRPKQITYSRPSYSSNYNYDSYVSSSSYKKKKKSKKCLIC